MNDRFEAADSQEILSYSSRVVKEIIEPPITDSTINNLRGTSRGVTAMGKAALRYVDVATVDYSEIASHYNAAIQGVVHCHAIDAARIERELQTDSDRFATQEMIVADQGFVHVAIRSDKHGRPGSPAAIRFLTFSAGNHRTGLELIRAAEQWARDRSAPKIGAFYQGNTYSFYHSSSACLSDRIGHVQALLQVSGYRKSRGEVFLDAENIRNVAPVDLESSYAVNVEHKITECVRPSYSIRISVENETAGVCSVVSRESFGGFAEESDRLFFSWVGVEDAYQRRGLGRYLVRRALQEGNKIGYKHASISTALDNDRAFALYANEGFRVVDWTYGWKKTL